MDRAHILDGRKLEVKRYLECLGEHGGSPDPKAFTMPEPVVLDSIHEYKLDFLSQSQTGLAELRRQLSTHHAKPKLDLDSSKLTIDCSLTPEVPQARMLAKTWHMDVDHVARNYLELIEVHTRKVLQQIWEEVEKAVKAGITNMKAAIVLPLPKEAAFVVVGMNEDVEKLYEKVHSTAKTVEDEIERKNQEITQKKKLKPFTVKLLSTINFAAQMTKLHENLKVEILEDEIVFCGSMTDVQHAQLEMYKHLENVKTKTVAIKSQQRLDLMSCKETRKYVTQKLQKESLQITWETVPLQGVVLHAFEEDTLSKAAAIIDSSVCECETALYPESAELPQSMEWKQMVDKLAVNKPGSLCVHPSANNTILITATDNLFHPAVEKIREFVNVHTIFTAVVFFSPSRQKVICSFLEDKLRKIERDLHSHKVQINFIDSNNRIEVRGRHQGLKEALSGLKKVGAGIVCVTLTVSDSAGTMFLETDCCLHDLEGVASRQRCVFAFDVEDPEMQVRFFFFFSPLA